MLTPIGGIQDSYLPLALKDLVRKAGTVLHVTLDENRAERLKACLAFFAPEVEVLYLPPWDCLPYDRVSPDAAVVSQRIATLHALLQQPAQGRPRLCLTTVNALTLRVMPRKRLEHAGISFKVGDTLNEESLKAYLIRNGYLRTDTVREAGEFAWRGGLFDLYPTGQDLPLRLDLFGDTIESIRSFDPATQRTLDTHEGAVSLLPITEFSLDEESIQHFRQSYREEFGAVLGDDPLYTAVTEGRRHGGMEHWLPLFYTHLDTVFDYVPEDVCLSLEAQTEEALDARLAQIADFYAARQDMVQVDKKLKSPPYKPVRMDSLFLNRAEWERLRDGRDGVQFSPYSPLSRETGEGVAEGDGRGHSRPGHNFAATRASVDGDLLDSVVEHIDTLKQRKVPVLLAGYTAGSRDRLVTMLQEHGEERVDAVDTWDMAQKLAAHDTIPAVVLPMDHGFEAGELCIVTEADIFGERLIRPARKRRKADNFITESSALDAGDLVVHNDHGLGRYDGLETLTVSGAPHDCLRILYADGDKLYVPVENIEVLSRYGDGEGASLDKLGGTAWQGRKAKVKKKLLEIAGALLKIAAERQLRKADRITPPDGLYAEFCARFPYPETEDQTRAIDEVLDDLLSGRPMDRLVCGDVGFGKTEVAMRAAFVVAATGKQVAIITPTTLLCRQHFRNFSERFKGMPLRIAQLSRLVSAKDSALTKKEIAEGKVDIVIGTHAILAKSFKAHNLGLVIVDEEQHFGVKQKERLKELRNEVHVLTLTATPIPRTLQLALAGVREMSLIATPPVDRLAVRSYVLPYDPVVIKEALMREHFRGGQSFYVCPRVQDLAKLQERLELLVPDLKVCVAHGQLSPDELEEVMLDFYGGKYDVLLATNIIESGLDIPNANTIIIHRADMFGLAQLYQLRGRVGRGKLRGYAYLTYTQGVMLSDTARRRLDVMGTLDSLGAGFTLASHDMDIRGGGNLLGEQQSGHIKEVGVELYQHMLEEAVAEIRAGESGQSFAESEWQPAINLGIPVLIPEAFVPELGVRLGLYRRLADLQTQEEISGFAAELADRFGKLPVEVENLLVVMGVKKLCKAAGVERCDAGPKGAVLTFRNNKHPNPPKLVEYLSKQGGAMKLRQDHKLVALRVWDNPSTRLKGVRRLMKELAETV